MTKHNQSEPTAHHEEPKKPVPSPTQKTPSRDPNQITITDKGFEPYTFPAKVNKPVKWVNESGNSCVVEFDTDGAEGSVAPPSSPELTETAPNYEYTFTVPGKYQYHLKDEPKKAGVVTVT